MRQQVVILSDHSLFAQGVASRFKQYPERVHLHFVNPRDDDSFNRIAAIQPAAVILSSSESDMREKCLLCDLVSTFPSIRIIRLAVDQDPVQVITSQQSRLKEVRDLLDLLDEGKE
ncbi:MAG: hypothetical protein AB1649_20650 [Chloroflexota bacterium]